ncbi:hypothetical protein GOBAR_DD03908 [Gossypium barbadense]|nr:hypothetical protein GOBAR_DD03908 [Gossypium barbadense]
MVSSIMAAHTFKKETKWRHSHFLDRFIIANSYHCLGTRLFFRNKRVDPLQTLRLAKDIACYWCSVFCTSHTVFMHPDANSDSRNGLAATIHNCYDYVGYVAWKKGDAGYEASSVITDGAERCLKQFCKTIAVADEVTAKLLSSENFY